MGGPLSRRRSTRRRRQLRRWPYALLGLAVVAAVGWRYSTDPVSTLGGVAGLSPAVIYAVPPDGPQLADIVDDSLFGLSGKLRARFVDRPLSSEFPVLPLSVDRGPG